MNEQTTYNEMMGAEKALKAYDDPNLTNNINKNVMSQWSPLLQNATQATQNQMSSFNNDYWSKLGYGALEGGTDAASLNPQQKLSVMGQGLGDMVGRLDSSSRLADMLGGKASDMAQRAQQAAQFGYQTQSAAYDRAAQRYQLAFQKAEADRARARAAAEANAQRQALLSQYGQMGQQGQAGGLGGEEDAIEVPDAPNTFDRKLGTQTNFNLGSPIKGYLSSVLNTPSLIGAYATGGEDAYKDELYRISPEAYVAKYGAIGSAGSSSSMRRDPNRARK